MMYCKTIDILLLDDAPYFSFLNINLFASKRVKQPYEQPLYNNRLLYSVMYNIER